MDLLKNQLPEDVNIRYEFDQSKYIERSLTNLIHEGILGAIFTGLMIFLFLGDSRGQLSWYLLSQLLFFQLLWCYTILVKHSIS